MFVDKTGRDAVYACQLLERTAEDRTLFLKNVIKRVIVHRDHVDVRLHVPALVNEILGAGGSTAGLLRIAVIECPDVSHLSEHLEHRGSQPPAGCLAPKGHVGVAFSASMDMLVP
jgi:hypothetical protein